MPKIMVGMSGGVDSSVAAAVLMNMGYEVCGATLRLHDESTESEELHTCCSLNDVLDARSVCDNLGIRHYVFNFKERFDEKVIKKFVNEYLCGRTPNPCIDCNKYIKFDKMLERAQLLGCDMIATGHYAVTGFDEKTGRYFLKKSADKNKDQSYVLYGMTQEQLKHTVFPLGEMTKDRVRKIAEKHGFVNAAKPDSQDICFVPSGDYVSFIEKYTGKPLQKGKFISKNGDVLGCNRGYPAYTIGQRKGLGIALGKPQYVVSTDPENNTVTLSDESDLFTDTAVVESGNFISTEKLTEPMRVAAKIRYRQPEQSATISPLDNGDVLLKFDAPQRAVSPGQAAVFYNGDFVIGGGVLK